MEEKVIEIKNGFKKYPNSDYILKGVNMNICKASIYSLLGPSGCGKTTLLSCIVGLQKLTHGFINMPSITSPKDIGYMPQDIALHTVCTTDELLYLYGLMFGMVKKDITKRSEYLSSLLNLPSRSIPIVYLSGGQQRRISFAVALLHNPDTLLLDEPTVGLDPLLRKSIWDYLQHVSKNENKAVIITTHYIEEASQSDMVGFMRDGTILKEGSPEIIMEQHQSINLEDAFIDICVESKKTVFYEKPPLKKSEGPKSTYTFQSEIFSFNRFKSQVYKDYLWTKRSLWLMLILLLLPASQSFLFALTFGQYSTDIKLGLYSEESPSSTTICSPHSFLRYYDEEYKLMNCTLKNSLSCEYLQGLRTRFDVVLYDDMEMSLTHTSKNKIWGSVHIHPNFTEAIISRIIDGRWADEDVITTSLVEVTLDMSNYVIGHHIKYKLKETLEDTMKFVARSCNLPEKFTKLPVRISEKFYKGDEYVASDSEIVGFLSGFTFYFATIFTASALSAEKQQGLVNRNRVTGGTIVEEILGRLVIQSIVLALQKAEMLLIFYGIFSHQINGNIFVILLGLSLIETVGISLGMVLANIIEAVLLINTTIVYFTFAIFFLAGSVWPEEGMHWLLNIYKWSVPAQPAVSSLRNVIIKDFSITSPYVYQGYLNCVLWVFILLFLTYLINKLKNR